MFSKICNTQTVDVVVMLQETLMLLKVEDTTKVSSLELTTLDRPSPLLFSCMPTTVDISNSSYVHNSRCMLESKSCSNLQKLCRYQNQLTIFSAFIKKQHSIPSFHQLHQKGRQSLLQCNFQVWQGALRS
ncbi:hypothetical protein Bhyg_14306, partial [Pseudolycoriella hygida]